MMFGQNQKLVEPEANEIVPGLWLGNDQSATPKFLRAKNVSHVLNITPDLPFPVLNGPKVQCLRIPVRSEDTYVPVFIAALPTVLQLIHRARTAGGTVLVHCKKGHTRSAVVVFAYLTMKLNFSPLAAEYWIQSRRPQALRRTVDQNCLMNAVVQMQSKENKTRNQT